MQSEQFRLHADIEQRHWWFVARRRIMRRLIAAILPPRAETLIVDVGCGTGANIAQLASDYRCLGIDSSAEAIGLAQSRFPAVKFLMGCAPEDLGPLVQEIDLLMMMDVLEHVPDDSPLLSRLVAAVRPGTHLLLSVPADMALWGEHDESFGHYRRYDREGFARLWSGLPVSCRLLSYFNSRLYWPVRAVRAIGRLRGKAAGAAGTDFWLPLAAVNSLLDRLFSGEAARLLRVLQGTGRPYRRGASLIAILRRC